MMLTDNPTLQEPIKNPGRFDWHKVTKVAHYYLPACAVLATADRTVDALTRPDLPAGRQVQAREESPPYGGGL